MSSEKYKPVSHIIFTLDGFMVNSDPVTRLILNEIVEKYGKGPLNLDLQHKLLGRNQKDTLNIVINELRLPIRYPELKEKVEKLEMQRFGKLKYLPGIERMICHCVRHKIPIALATSSRMETIELKSGESKGLLLNFSHIVSGSDDPEVPQSKPDPTIFKVCASRFDPPPERESCLVLEDSPAGVAAACCAGMQTVMVPDPLLDPELTKEATLVLKTFADFRPELFGLPKIPR